MPARKTLSSGGSRLSDNGNGKSGIKLAIKLIVTAILLWVAFRSVDVAAVSALLSGLDPWWAAIALLLTGLIIVSDAALLTCVMQLFERRLPFVTALVYSLVGWFFSNVAPSTVGGDIFRGVQLSRVGTPIGAAVRVILSMRLLSFATLVAVMIAGFPVALTLVGNERDVIILGCIVLAGTGALAGVLLLTQVARFLSVDRWPWLRKFHTLSEDFRKLLVPSSRVAATWLAALSQHLVRIAILSALAAGLSLEIPVATLFAFTPVALLTAMVPISFGGWGVRELSFVYFLGTAGVSAEEALSLSIAFGLLRVVVGAAGGVTWALLNDDHYRVDAPSA